MLGMNGGSQYLSVEHIAPHKPTPHTKSPTHETTTPLPASTSGSRSLVTLRNAYDGLILLLKLFY